MDILNYWYYKRNT